jgi:hypothetical protein
MNTAVWTQDRAGQKIPFALSSHRGTARVEEEIARIFCGDIPIDPPDKDFHRRPQRSQRFNQSFSVEIPGHEHSLVHARSPGRQA